MRTRRWKLNLSVIEVVEIVAIVAVLAAVLCPVFKAARMNNKMGLCASNHKQLAAAFEQYVEEWDGMACSTGTYSSHTMSFSFWAQKLDPYVHSNREACFCAELPSLVERPYENTLQLWLTTIGMNLVFGSDYCSTRPIPISQVNTPEATILFACSSYIHYGSAKWGHYAICPGCSTTDEELLSLAPRVNPTKWQYNFFDPARHDGHVVVTHADGHASVYTPEELLTPGSTNRNDYKNPDFSMWDLY